MFFYFQKIIDTLNLRISFNLHTNTPQIKSENKLRLEKTKLDREIKYREAFDNYSKSLVGRGVTVAGAKPHFDGLKRQKDQDIELIDFEIRKLELEESSNSK
jgi:hypothetical protein